MYYVDDYIHSGDFYDEVNKEKQDDVSFYLDICREYGGNVCEACCGTGRITIPLALQGIDIVGFDRSESMIKRGKKKAQELGVNVSFWVSELTENICDKQFDIVICPFNSLQYFYNFEQIRMAFFSIRQLLKDNAILCFDVFNPKISKLAISVNDSFLAERKVSDNISIREESVYNAVDQVIRTTWEVLNQEKQVRKCVLDSRCYFPQELDNLLRLFGYKIEYKWGDFCRTSFSAASPKQVIVARKC